MSRSVHNSISTFSLYQELFQGPVCLWCLCRLFPAWDLLSCLPQQLVLQVICKKKSSESIIWNKKFGKKYLIALLVTSFSYPKVNNWKNMYWNHFFLLLSFLFCFGIIWVIYSELSLLSMLEGICRFGPFMNDVDLHCLLLVWIEVKLKT